MTDRQPSALSAHAQGEVIVQVFGRTDVGRTREHNEDAFVVADLTANNATLQPEVRTHTAGDKGTLFMVADGMGGAAAGEIASEMAVKIVLRELQSTWIERPLTSAEAFVRAIKQATKAANEQINAYAGHHPEYRGMGTTATIAGLLGDTLYLAQVGDSRAYLVRNGMARQITKDQSLMQKLIEAGEITEEEAEHSERRNIILQALGPEQSIKIDLTHQQVRRGDLLVLCSDGLSGQVSKDEIARVVGGTSDLTAACKTLIDRANASGGPDNITVIVARFDGAGLRDPNDEDTVGHQVFPLPETGQTPAMAVDRVIDQTSPTGPMQAVRRKTVPIPEAAVPPTAERRKTVPLPADDPPMVSATRRSVGRLIAVTLLGLLLLGVGYFAMKMYGNRPKADTTQLGAPGSPRH